ncbi:MAG: hypothetical protein NTV20_02030 [Candidatus Shapirobacteria bacterium]|nr:hypothetical protein [Candidatus Shapirobacteria bacterium]
METKDNFFEKFWYLFVIIAIVLIGIVSTLWIINQKSLKLSKEKTTPPIVQQEVTPQPTSTVIADETTIKLETQSDSDEIGAIENDIKATDLSNIDKEMADIEGAISTPE